MAREVRVAILGDSRDFSRAVRSVQGDASKLDGVFSGIKRAALGMGVAFAGREVFELGASFVSAAEDSIKVSKQTDAVLKSMGTQSGMTAKKIADLSDKLSKQAGIDDELIQSSQNVLLTFGKVRNEVGKGNQIFDRAAQSALDMSVALGTDLQSATTMVGKALNDPIAGLTSLTRAGIQFTDQQKDQIRTLVESGDQLGAQKIIMEELERQFAGSAEAQATATDKLRVAWDNVKETLGKKLLPVVEKVAEWLAEKLPGAMDKVSQWIDQTGAPAFADFRDWFTAHIIPALAVLVNFVTETVVPGLQKIADWITSNESRFQAFKTLVGVGLVGAFVAWAWSAAVAAAATIAATWPVWLLVGAVAALTMGTQWLIDKFDLLPKASGVFQFFIDLAVRVWSVATAIWAAVDGLQVLINLADRVGGWFSGLNGPAGELQAKIAGKRAAGGPVSARSPYLVGERGPELFMPGASGTIIPNHRLAMAGGGGAQTIVVQIGDEVLARVVANAGAVGARRGIG